MPFWSRIQLARRRMNGTEATALIKWTWEAIVIRLCAVEDPDYADGILKAAAVAVLSKHQLTRLIQRACVKRLSALSA